MKLFNKTALAISFSIFGAICSVSALAMATDSTVSDKLQKVHKLYKIEIQHSGDDDAMIFVSDNGNVKEFTIDKDSFIDKEQLELALIDIPADIRGKIFVALEGINHGVENHIVIEIDDELERHVNWVGESVGENVVIIANDADYDHHVDISTKVSKKVSKHIFKKLSNKPGLHVMEFKHGGKMTKDSVIRLLSRGEFSADELNEIQMALDSKR